MPISPLPAMPTALYGREAPIERHLGVPSWSHVLLIASAAMQGDMLTASEALATMHRLRPDFSIGWVKARTTWTGEMRERLLDGLRKAGVPEE